MHESYVYDEVAKSKMVVCNYLCKHIRILNIYRNINDILHFGVLFVICLFFLVAHFVSYSLFRMLVSLFYCFNTVVKSNNISSFDTFLLSYNYLSIAHSISPSLGHLITISKACSSGVTSHSTINRVL